MKNFNVYTWYPISEDNEMDFVPWYKDLRVVIIKDGVTLTLNEDEIREVINSLPRTHGGEY